MMLSACLPPIHMIGGYLFLGDTEGLWFAGGTMNGESKLRFVSNSTDIRERFLADVRCLAGKRVGYHTYKAHGTIMRII